MTSLLHRGNFGIAQQYFRDAVEKAPKNASAWIGLAASYDRLGRFDLADPSLPIGHSPGAGNNRHSQQSRLLLCATWKLDRGAPELSQGLGTRTWQSDNPQQS
jgi:tetratricopeptide (TPR) repeat protein